MRVEKIGGLEVRITGGVDREGGGVGPVVILLHGFGAPGDDLVSIWRTLDVPDEVRFVFPVGPLSVDLGLAEGRAWWMIDMEQLALDQASGRERDPNVVPVGLAEARQSVLTFLDGLLLSLRADPSQIVLGGFSQGAMLACDVVLRSSRPFTGLVLMSGTLIAKDEWISLIPNYKGLPVFQSHGTEDPLLSFSRARELHDLLNSAGLDVTWIGFEGGHEIPDVVSNRLGQFISKVLVK